jgi:hypothetical protein
MAGVVVQGVLVEFGMLVGASHVSGFGGLSMLGWDLVKLGCTDADELAFFANKCEVSGRGPVPYSPMPVCGMVEGMILTPSWVPCANCRGGMVGEWSAWRGGLGCGVWVSG